MAYDEIIADRIRLAFANRNSDFTEKKMMGGLCFMIEEKMCCGVHIDKKSASSLLMIRVGEKVAEEFLETGEPHIEPMDFTGQPMKGYLLSAKPTSKQKNHWADVFSSASILIPTQKPREKTEEKSDLNATLSSPIAPRISGFLFSRLTYLFRHEKRSTSPFSETNCGYRCRIFRFKRATVRLRTSSGYREIRQARYRS